MLSTLPPKLLIQILEKTDFDSHLNLALTCRRFSACLEPTLARHRDVHQRCRHMSSADSGTIRDLVRSVIGLDDPIYAWHVRTLDIWYYDEAYPSGWSSGVDGNGETVTDFDTWWPWRTGEKDAYRSFLHQYFVPDKVKKYMDLVEIRELSFLRTVLFYTLPRLREIRFVTYGHISQTLDELCAAQMHLKEGHLPVLQQLDTVIAGLPLSDDEWDSHACGVDYRTLLHLMRLPNLKTLYCRGLSMDSNLFKFWPDLAIPPAPSHAETFASSLEHLYLDDVAKWPEEMAAYQHSIAQIPAALKSFAIRPRQDSKHMGRRRRTGAERCALAVLKHQAKTLQTCLIYDPQVHRRGLSCMIKMPATSKWRLQHCLNKPNPTLSQEVALQQTLCRYIDFFTTEVAASGLSVLNLHGDDPNQFLGWPKGIDVLEEAVVALIRSNKKPSLTTIHLLGFEDRAGLVDATHGTIRFQKAIVEGIKHSVDVYTSTTPRPLMTRAHPWSTPFPLAFKDGSPLPEGTKWWKVGEDDDWKPMQDPRVFNARTGGWEDPLCNKCGDCETCFEQYPKESWDVAKEERAAARRERDSVAGNV